MSGNFAAPVGDLSTVIDFLQAGSDLFPGWLSIAFSVGLGLGIAQHVPCLVGGHGNRWFHAGHVVMALSMIYMYLSMSYVWTWLPAAWQLWFFVATSVAITGYVGNEFRRGRRVNFSWVLLLIGHLAMIYMWFPLRQWDATVIFVLVSWFGVEAAGWAAGVLPDAERERAGHRWIPHQVGAAGMRTRVGAGRLASAPQVHGHGRLTASSWQERAAMAVMAVSMGYMFYGMELMNVQMVGM